MLEGKERIIINNNNSTTTKVLSYYLVLAPARIVDFI